MGHLVNPISIRLGVVKTWNSTWVTNKGVSYTYLLSKDIELQKSLDIFFNKSNTTDVWAIIFDKAFVIRTSKQIFVFIILYSWKFFNMVDNIFDVVFKGKGAAFKDNVFKNLRDAENDKKKLFNGKNNKQLFSASKKSIELYSELLKVSIDDLKNSTIMFLKCDFFNIVLNKILKDFLSLKVRYLSFFRSFYDFILIRNYSMQFVYLLENFDIFLTLDFSEKVQLTNFLKLLLSKLFIVFTTVRNQFNTLFFHLLKKKVVLNYINVFINKKLTKLKYKKKRFFFIKKTKINKTFGINNVILDNVYLSTLLHRFNTKLKSFTYLLKQNNLWLIFVFIKIFLRKNMANYYGKRLWYIKSYVEYFFNYKNSQGSVINTLFLFPSYVLLTAKMISYVIRIRLTQKYSLGEILNKFVNFLNKESELIGFRITCHGRFTRRQRASHRLVKSSLKNKDKLLLNTFSGFVDYAYVEQPLKYGMCGIRIWLVKDPQFESIQYHSFLRHFVLRKNYKKHYFDIFKLNRFLRFLDMYKVNTKKKNSIFFKYKIFKKKQKRLARYLKIFHFMYYLRLKKYFHFGKHNLKTSVYSSSIIKTLKKNMFLLY